MKTNEILKMKAEAHTNHLIAKLNEAEAEALNAIVKYEEKINTFKSEIKSCKSKKVVLQQSFDELSKATTDSWDQANQKFIESVESLEDKSAFRNKTDEWFENVREVATKLKEDVKEKVAQM